MSSEHAIGTRLSLILSLDFVDMAEVESIETTDIND